MEHEEKQRWWKFGWVMGFTMLGVGWLMYLIRGAGPSGPEQALWPPMLLMAVSAVPLHDEPRLLKIWAYLMGAAGGLACLMLLWGLAFWCICLGMTGLVLATQKEAGDR